MLHSNTDIWCWILSDKLFFSAPGIILFLRVIIIIIIVIYYFFLVGRRGSGRLEWAQRRCFWVLVPSCLAATVLYADADAVTCWLTSLNETVGSLWMSRTLNKKKNLLRLLYGLCLSRRCGSAHRSVGELVSFLLFSVTQSHSGLTNFLLPSVADDKSINERLKSLRSGFIGLFYLFIYIIYLSPRWKQISLDNNSQLKFIIIINESYV